ncbi:uncharacterized protein LOC114332061 [Diabrotica virgifera virgifera]|uniref:Uncharacterized protein LOC114332061 isoform X2 n=1 Tax=Diabrotica virgifera virgifera TaxID=50390 RepID=A0A6P7FS09_DIAVI|nr:uncharacterized protein LOC114332061 [Diabrotica virgifera virgifera]
MSNLIQIKFKLIDRNLKVLTAPETSNVVKKPLRKSIFGTLGSQIEHRSEFNLKCAICQTYCIFSFSSCPVTYYYIYEDNKIVCYYCTKCFKLFFATGKLSKRTIPTNILETIKFFKWYCSGCCNEIEFSDMQSHEIICKGGRQHTCPIKYCFEKGTANKMTEHLKDWHGKIAFGSHFKLPTNFGSCYIFVREHIVRLRVTSEFSLTSSLDHGSVHVELVTKNDGDDHISPYALFCNKKNEIITDYSKLASSSEVFVKVVVA